MEIKSKSGIMYSKYIMFKISRVINEEMVEIEYSNHLSKNNTVKVVVDTNVEYNNECYKYIQYSLIILPHKMIESTFIILGDFDELYEYNKDYIKIYPV